MSPADLTLYCERAGAGLWAEPLNALSNAGFALATLLGWRRLPRPTPGDLRAAVLLMGAVAIGSALWHTLAAPWAQAADVVPILLLVTTLLGSSLHRLLALPRRRIAPALILFVLVTAGGAALFPPPLLNGSLGYVPTFVALALLSIVRRGRPEARPLATATALFAAALLFRTIDLGICDAFPWGTHWAWHLCNAVVLHLVLRVLIDQQRRAGQVSR